MMTTLTKKIASRLPFLNKSNGDDGIASGLKKIATANDKICLGLLTTQHEGLTPGDVEERQELYGLNEISHEKAPAWYIQLLHAFITPFNGVLFFVAVISLITDVWLVGPDEKDYKTVTLLSIMVLLSSLIRFWQEFRSNKAAERLKSMVKTTATVLRQGQGKREINIEELVPGDIVFLSAGDMIPADCRILQSKDLFVSQSILSGESLPVEKREFQVEDPDNKSLLDLDNICFMGTNAMSGAATAVVITTGNQTYFGSISKSLTGKRTETSFDKGVNSVSWLLIRFIFVMVPLVFLINGFTKGNWLEAFLFAITVAVGLTPEMLPMIVTTNLAKGAVNMSKRKVIVKRLNAIQNIGAMDILCTDKTGTLTLDK
ncbi:MAG: HAD-IC family P-type ATPase, partial [Chitinophagales bacterium]